MFEEMTEQQAREQILEMTKEYCEKYHNQKKPYEKGDRIPYASRVYDADEMVNLVDSSLEFWLTSGRFTKEFESEFAKYLGVNYRTRMASTYFQILEFDARGIVVAQRACRYSDAP